MPVGGAYMGKERDLSFVECCFCADLQVDTLYSNFFLIEQKYFCKVQMFENKCEPSPVKGFKERLTI